MPLGKNISVLWKKIYFWSIHKLFKFLSTKCIDILSTVKFSNVTFLYTICTGISSTVNVFNIKFLSTICIDTLPTVNVFNIMFLSTVCIVFEVFMLMNYLIKFLLTIRIEKKWKVFWSFFFLMPLINYLSFYWQYPSKKKMESFLFFFFFGAPHRSNDTITRLDEAP